MPNGQASNPALPSRRRRRAARNEFIAANPGDDSGFSRQLRALEQRLAGIERNAATSSRTVSYLQDKLAESGDRGGIEKALAATQSSVVGLLQSQQAAIDRLAAQRGIAGAYSIGASPGDTARWIADVVSTRPLPPSCPFLDTTVLASHDEYATAAADVRTVWFNPTGIGHPGIVFDLADPTDPKILSTFQARRDIATAATSAEVMLSAITIEPAGLSASSNVLRGVVEAAVIPASSELLTFNATSPLVSPQAAEIFPGHSAVTNAPLQSGVQMVVPGVITSQSPGARPTQAVPGATVIRDSLCYRDSATAFTPATGLIPVGMDWTNIAVGTATIEATISHKYTGTTGGDVRWRVMGKFVTAAGLAEEQLFVLVSDTVTQNDELSMANSRVIELCIADGSHPTSLLYGVYLECEACELGSATSAVATLVVHYNDFSSTADNLQMIATVSDCDTGFHVASLRSIEYLRDIGGEFSQRNLEQDYLPKDKYAAAFAEMFNSEQLELVTAGTAEGQPGAFSLKRVFRQVGRGLKKGWNYAKHHFGDEMVDLAMEGFDQVLNALPIPKPATLFIDKSLRSRVEKVAHKMLTGGETKGAISQMASMTSEEQNRFLREHADEIKTALEADPELQKQIVAHASATQPKSFLQRLSLFSGEAAAFNAHAYQGNGFAPPQRH